MKPFDLQAALRGEPVVTKDGRKVLTIVHWDFPWVKDKFKVTALIDGEEIAKDYDQNGRMINHETDSKYYLFMAPRTKKLWIAVENKMLENDTHFSSCAYNTKQELLDNLLIDKENEKYFQIKEIEIEV